MAQKRGTKRFSGFGILLIAVLSNYRDSRRIRPFDSMNVLKGSKFQVKLLNFYFICIVEIIYLIKIDYMLHFNIYQTFKRIFWSHISELFSKRILVLYKIPPVEMPQASPHLPDGSFFSFSLSPISPLDRD